MITDAAGIATATASTTGVATHVIAYGATAPDATIGSLAIGTSSVFGLIDDVKYYDDVRSNSDLAADYNAGVAAIPEPSSAMLLGAV